MENFKRYLPQIRVTNFGKEGQTKIFNSKVLVVGCGALGSPVAMYLAGAGIGKIVIADFDTIDISNLHRQVFYSEKEAGSLKAESIKRKITELNSQIDVEIWCKLITERTLRSSQEQFDIIVDAADNPATTYLLESYCKETDIPLISAGVSGWEAQVFTFIPGSFSYSDIFPAPDETEDILPCSIEGIMGATSAFAASLQTAEVIKIILGLNDKKSRLVIGNLLSGEFKVISC